MEKKKCIACDNEIPIQASICTECNSFQSQWKNNLRYSANVIGLVSVVLSAIVFIISSFPEVRKVVAWQDKVKVLSFNSTKPISIANIGDGDIFVTHIQIVSSKPAYKKAERIDSIIQPGRTVTINRAEGEFSHLASYDVATSDDPEMREYFLREAKEPHTTGCVLRVVAVPEDPGFMTYYATKGENMITYDVEAYVQFYSLKKQKWVSQEISLIGYLWFNEDVSSCWPDK